jgi:hypothetical protein
MKNHRYYNTESYGNTQLLKTRELYITLVKRHFERPDIAKKWNIPNSEVSENAFKYKVNNVTETKLAEFGFKMLHKILACPANLKKWKIIDNSDCSLCLIEDDIKHLLVNCRISEFAWQIVFNVLEIDAETCEHVVLFGHSDKDKNAIIVNIAYFIYKYWILQNNEHKSKDIVTFKRFLQHELELKIKIYKVMKSHSTYAIESMKNILLCMKSIKIK